MTTRITREDLVAQSIFDQAKHVLLDVRGYPPDKVEFRTAFPYELEAGQLTRNIVAVGFDFDDEGQAAEMGSDLMVKLYTCQFWTFGLSETMARNLAQALKFGLIPNGPGGSLIPLKDITQESAPVIDQLVVESTSAEKQILPDPQPWQEHVWTMHLHVQDEYHAGLA